MINKFFKTIHNRYSNFFRFIFFLRYLLSIFLVSITIFLIIPKFFDYEKKSGVIKTHLFKNYDLKIDSFEKIKFNVFPLPNLNFKNVLISVPKSSVRLIVKDLKIFPKLLNIYNYEDFRINEIYLDNNEASLDFSDVKFFIKIILNQKKKISFENLDLNIIEKENTILKLKNIKFSNFGFDQNLFEGKIFEKKFKAEVINNLEKIKFKIPNSGINIEINLDSNQKKNVTSGILESKILNASLRLNFDYYNKTLNIYKSYFRSKNLSFNNKSNIVLKPFLYVNSKFYIEVFDKSLLQKLDLNKIFKSKDIIKKLNFDNEINYNSKKFNRNSPIDYFMKINLAYGRINYLKKISISNNSFQCKGDINLLEEFPTLYFYCNFEINDKKNFFKYFSIKLKNKSKNENIKIVGNLNILKNKIYFKNIETNKNYIASREDLKFFKLTFEKIVLKNDIFEIFNKKKIKEFIIEII